MHAQGKRCHLYRAGGLRGPLPPLVTAQGEDERKRGGRDDEIRSRAGAAEEVERQRRSLAGQARDQGAGGLGFRGAYGGLRHAQRGLHERGRRRAKSARSEEHESMLIDKVSGGFQRKERTVSIPRIG